MSVHGHKGWNVKPACQLRLADHRHLLEVVSLEELTELRAS